MNIILAHLGHLLSSPRYLGGGIIITIRSTALCHVANESHGMQCNNYLLSTRKVSAIFNNQVTLAWLDQYGILQRITFSLWDGATKCTGHICSTAQDAHYLPRAVCQTAGRSANTQSSYFMRRDKQHGIKPIHVAQLSSLSPGTESNSTWRRSRVTGCATGISRAELDNDSPVCSRGQKH